MVCVSSSMHVTFVCTMIEFVRSDWYRHMNVSAAVTRCCVCYMMLCWMMHGQYKRNIQSRNIPCRKFLTRGISSLLKGTPMRLCEYTDRICYSANFICKYFIVLLTAKCFLPCFFQVIFHRVAGLLWRQSKLSGVNFTAASICSRL